MLPTLFTTPNLSSSMSLWSTMEDFTILFSLPYANCFQGSVSLSKDLLYLLQSRPPPCLFTSPPRKLACRGQPFTRAWKAHCRLMNESGRYTSRSGEVRRQEESFYEASCIVSPATSVVCTPLPREPQSPFLHDSLADERLGDLTWFGCTLFASRP